MTDGVLLIPSVEPKRIDYLDGWRGVAILCVILAHYRLVPALGTHVYYTPVGGIGVDLFFVLSGRLMAEILFVRNRPIAVFYWRRVTRIFPALAVFVSVIYVLGQFVPQIAIYSGDVIIVLTTIANYIPVSGSLGQLWSICIEEHAYILLSLVAVLQRKTGLSAVALLISITVACMANGVFQTLILKRDMWVTYLHSDVRMSSVFVSALIYLILRDHQPKLSGAARLLPIALLIFGLAVMLPASIHLSVKYVLGTTLIALGFNLLNQAPSPALAILQSPILRWIGIWSFSIYLWQQPPIFLLETRSAFLVLAGVMVVSLASFYLIEKPCRSFLNRTRTEKPAIVSAAHASN